MLLAPETELTVEMMTEVAILATKVTFEPIMSVRERNDEVAEIAKKADVAESDIVTLLRQHVHQRTSGGQPSRCCDAYVDLMQSNPKK